MGSTVRSYQDLVVWQQSIALAAACYKTTKSFPVSEMYGLTSQIRRAAASIPANIAEGNGREHTGAYINALRIAQGSLKELETHVLLAEMVDLLDKAEAARLIENCDGVGRLLRALIRALQEKDRR
ncbi:MAG: four helix bundle protein [Hyphomicrobium sp.]|nr:four helix bundle protein [Hyphomicrobium sp.]